MTPAAHGVYRFISFGDSPAGCTMSIVTKKGDAGTTGLIGGARVSKADLRVIMIAAS